MASYTLNVNTSTIIFLPGDFSDQGWTISEGIASHDGCNAGYIRNSGIDLQEGESYVVSFEVVHYESGIVKAMLGTASGPEVSAAGAYSQQIICQSNTEFKFYSDGKLSIRLVSVYPAGNIQDNSVTLAFREDGKRWVTFYSFKPETMITFLNDFFTFRGGLLWRHNVNEVRNRFYGQQYKSVLHFMSNKEPSLNKIFSSIKIDGRGSWAIPSMRTNSTDQFPIGMVTRLKTGNIKLIDGKYWADIMRDMNDPRFRNIPDIDRRKLTALFEGREMQGNYLEIELETGDTDEVKLVSFTVFSTEVPKNF